MSHLSTTRNPQSEARRQHVHGHLVPLCDDRPTFSLIEFGAVAVLVTAVTLLIVAFS